MKHFSIILALCLGLAMPTFASEKVDDGKSKERIEKELQAMQERPAQTKCPISGRDIAEGKGVAYMGHFIATCCDNCAKVVEASPLVAMLKVRQNGEEPQLAEGFKYHDRCPMSGKPVKEDVHMVKNNALVKFCCPGCPAGYAEDPEGITSKLIDQKTAPYIITLEQTGCPVSGHPVEGGPTVTAKGKEIKLCCAGCTAPVEENPEQFLQAMADEGVVPAEAK